MAYRFHHKSFNKILILVFGVAFGLVALAMGYQAVQQTADVRSRAAVEGTVYKSWNFNKTTEGWKTTGGHTISVMKGGYLNFTIGKSRNVPMLENSNVNVTMPVGKKNLVVTFLLEAANRARDTKTETVQGVMEETGGPVPTSGIGKDVPVSVQLGTPFTLEVSYKLRGQSWSKNKLSYSGKTNASYNRFTIPFPLTVPESGKMMIEQIRIQFTSGFVAGNHIRIDQIQLTGSSTSRPTPYPSKYYPSPSVYPTNVYPSVTSGPVPTGSPLPSGCYYKQVQCFTEPCKPILVCPTPTSSPSPYFIPSQ